MAVLSDRDIKELLKLGELVISNIEQEQIGSCSVDLCLGNTFRVFKHAEVTHVDPKEGIADSLMELVTKENTEPFIIHPGEFVLGTTRESVLIPRYIVARLDGRSSWGRLGIIVHSTAGSVHPGYVGQLTLEIANISKVPVKLWPGAKICQIMFERLSSPCEQSYAEKKSKYMNQQGPQSSKIKLD